MTMRQWPRKFITRHPAVLILFVTAIALAKSLGTEPSATPIENETTYRHRFDVGQRNLTATGASSCSSSACHGGATPRPGERFLGNEWDRWWNKGQGPHFRAFKVLVDDKRSDRMVKILYGPQAVAGKQSECRACHTLDVPERFRGRAFDANDEGVSCEACHGRSEKWIGPHQNQRIWRGEKSEHDRTAMGFYDTLNPIRRAEQCLSCHLGTESRRVTHAMLAAGHPTLTFELASDLNDVPKHWRDEYAYLSPEEKSWFFARIWAVGQIVTFRETMTRLVRWTQENDATDYSVLECYACHHDIQSQSWRQQQEFRRSPGQPVWDAAPWAMVRAIVSALMPGNSDFARHIKPLMATVSIHNTDRTKLRASASALARLADDLAQKAVTTSFDVNSTRTILQAITSEARPTALIGYRAAVQAYLAVEALYVDAWAASPQRPKNHDAIYKTIMELHDSVYVDSHTERPSAYDAFAFGALLRKLGDQLPIP